MMAAVSSFNCAELEVQTVQSSTPWCWNPLGGEARLPGTTGDVLLNGTLYPRLPAIARNGEFPNEAPLLTAVYGRPADGGVISWWSVRSNATLLTSPLAALAPSSSASPLVQLLFRSLLSTRGGALFVNQSQYRTIFCPPDVCDVVWGSYVA
jgi:hypothetical protein